MGENLNIRTTAALILFIPLALYIVRRKRPALATATLLIFGLLFLPMLAGFKLPGLPFFGKHHLVPTWTFLALLVFRRQRIVRPRLGRVPWTLIIASSVGALMTSITNADPQTFGPTYIQALGLYDTVHAVLDDFMTLWLPMIIGASMFRSYDDLVTLFRVIVVGAVVYAIPVLIELRLSPQMHNWVYGFSQHDFSQTIRGGGYRPMVFMSHGLPLALFTCAAVLCAAAMRRAKERIGRFQAWIPMSGLFGILVLLKSLGALVFGLIGTPLTLLAGIRVQHLVAIALAVTFFVYPMARSAGTVPDDELVSLVEEYAGSDRSGSLAFRLQNEKALIQRANERLLFGWGGFCRACIFDPYYGDLISVRDGGWIITLGDRGVTGLVTQFGIIGYALFLANRRRRRIPDRRARALYATLSLITALYLFDCLPNGLYNFLPYVFAGVLISAGRDLAATDPRGRRRRGRRTRAGRRRASAGEAGTPHPKAATA